MTTKRWLLVAGLFCPAGGWFAVPRGGAAGEPGSEHREMLG